MIKCIGVVLAASTLFAQPSVEGDWQGTLQAESAKLRLALHVTQAGGVYSSTLDSLDQGAMGIRAAKTTVSGNALHVEFPAMHASYDAALSADGNSLSGKFVQGAALPLDLHRASQSTEVKRPQMPQPPFPYRSEDVTYTSHGTTLSGTLTIPAGPGPFPAALLITGSGTHDRDETLFGHKPFLVVADSLTRRGIAVLRMDDRRDKSRSTFDILADDALAGVAFLAARKDINAKKIGLIGHSEGACVGPLAATRSDRVAFVVMLAGIGVTGEEALLKQGELLVRSQGMGDAAVKSQRQVQQTLFDIVKEEKDSQAATQKLLAALRKLAPGAPEDGLKAEVAKANSQEIRSILGYDGGPVLRAVKVPVLALDGSRDLQVSAEQNLPAIAAALKAAGNRDFTTTELPGLNHLFQKCKTCLLSEYGELEETFSPDALKLMGDWIVEHTR